MMQPQQPNGLQALLQRPQKSQRTDIPAGMQALIAAQQVLRRQASPVTPDGRPTIAGMTEQAISQQAQPQMPPQGMPQGMPAQASPQMQPQDPGTVAQAAQASAIAGQQQQVQQQQAMQAAMQMAQQQQPQQGMARGGLASLPADNIARMKYARGGVIGYDGTDESAVKNPAVERILAKGPYERTAEDNKILEEAGYPLTRKEIGPEGNIISRINQALESPFIRRLISGGAYTQSNEELAQRNDPGAINERIYRSLGGAKYGTEPQAVSAATTPAVEQAAQAANTGDEAERLANRTTWTLDDLIGAKRKPQVQVAPSAPRAGIQTLPSVAAQAAMPVNPDLEAVRKLRDEQFKGTAPTPESLMAEREKFRQAQGLSGAVGSSIEDAIRRAEARAAETKAAYEQGTQGRGLENLIAALSAGARGRAGSLGAQYVAGQQANQQADMQFRQLMDASAEKRDQMAMTVQSLREAAANNDMATYQKEMENFRKQKHDFETTNRQLAATAAQASTTMQEGALNRASQERLHMMDNQFRLALHQSPSPSLERDIIAAYMKQGLSMPQAYERLMNVKTGDRADIAREKNEIAREKLASTDPNYQMLKMNLISAKTPEKKAQIQADIDEYERKRGIMPTGASGMSADKLSAADRIAGVK